MAEKKKVVKKSKQYSRREPRKTADELFKIMAYELSTIKIGTISLVLILTSISLILGNGFKFTTFPIWFVFLPLTLGVLPMLVFLVGAGLSIIFGIFSAIKDRILRSMR